MSLHHCAWKMLSTAVIPQALEAWAHLAVTVAIINAAVTPLLVGGKEASREQARLSRAQP